MALNSLEDKQRDERKQNVQAMITEVAEANAVDPETVEIQKAMVTQISNKRQNHGRNRRSRAEAKSVSIKMLK